MPQAPEQRTGLPPALRAAEATRRTGASTGEETTALSMVELAVLAHAMANDLPVLTGNRRQTALATELDLEVHHYFHP